jgi:hypothetical protein
MVGSAHGHGIFTLGDSFTVGGLSSGKAWIYILIGLVVIAVLEANALGYISGRGNTGLNVIYETHRNAMLAGFGLIVVMYILAEIILRS